LSDKVAEKSLIVLESFNLEKPQTKIFAGIKKNLPLVGKKILMVFSGKEKNMQLASRNVVNIKQVSLQEISTLDVLKSDSIVITKEAVDFWTKVYKK